MHYAFHTQPPDSMLDEFKKFAMRGNVIDMAVGIIIGAAFGTIVQSLVKDVITPPLGLLIGDVDFTNLFVVLKEGTTEAPYATLQAAQEAGAVTMNYGLFINTVISFTIVAFAIFLLIRYINKLQQPETGPAPPPTMKKCPHCVSDVSVNATRCPHCTSDLEAAPTT